jgi:GntR family transcriptional regulator
MYLQIMEQIRHRIAIGDWQPGRELPSIRALAASVQVSVITVKRAYLELEREGVIVTRQGIGSVVAERADLSVQLRRSDLDQHLAAAVDIGRQLGMTPDDLATRLRAAADTKDGKDL